MQKIRGKKIGFVFQDPQTSLNPLFKIKEQLIETIQTHLNLSYEEALNILTTLTGVGDKVANCVLLFSLDKPEAFPVDTWIYKAIQKWYMQSKPKIPRTKLRPWAMDYFGKNAGWANHYLFHDLRTSNYKTIK